MGARLWVRQFLTYKKQKDQIRTKELSQRNQFPGWQWVGDITRVSPYGPIAAQDERERSKVTMSQTCLQKSHPHCAPALGHLKQWLVLTSDFVRHSPRESPK